MMHGHVGLVACRCPTPILHQYVVDMYDGVSNIHTSKTNNNPVNRYSSDMESILTRYGPAHQDQAAPPRITAAALLPSQPHPTLELNHK